MRVQHRSCHQSEPLNGPDRLVLFDIELVWRNGGMRALLMTLTEGPADVAPEIAMTLLTLVDRPHTRVFLDGGVDLEVFHELYRVPVIIFTSIS